MRKILAVLSLLPSIGWADTPQVMTDIAPIHSLTAQVMGDLGTPGLLLPPGADPHDFSLRPSDAENLQDADVVIWVGEGLTPWLEEPLESLASDALTLELLATSGWEKLKPEETHEDGHDEDGHDEDGHDEDGHEEDEHGEDGHEEDEHAEEAHAGHHNHGDTDPHGWLDPVVARQWLNSIADTLSEADPDNADTYHANAEDYAVELATLQDQITAQVAPIQGRTYIIGHDGFAYFENRFGLSHVGAITEGSGGTSGPANMAELRDMVLTQDVNCVFSHIEAGPSWVQVIIEGTDAKTSPLDGTGTGLTAGPGLYTEMLERMATNLVSCLSPS